jgi:hypothetical protein
MNPHVVDAARDRDDGAGRHSGEHEAVDIEVHVRPGDRDDRPPRADDVPCDDVFPVRGEHRARSKYGSPAFAARTAPARNGMIETTETRTMLRNMCTSSEAPKRHAALRRRCCQSALPTVVVGCGPPWTLMSSLRRGATQCHNNNWVGRLPIVRLYKFLATSMLRPTCPAPASR